MPEHLIGDKDALAAEYVLGTLDFEERAAAQSLRAQDAEFAGKVTVWERRLGELHLMVEPVEPELEIWQRIRTKLPEVHRPEPIIAVLDAEPELKPELESDRIPEAQLAPAEPKAAEPKAAEPEAAEPEPAPGPKSEPELSGVKEIPIATDAPPAAPEAPAVSSWQPAPAEPAGVIPSAAPFGVSAAATSAVADALAVPEPPFPAAVTPSPPEVAADEKLRVAKRHLALWRTAALLMAVAALAVAALVSFWRYLPERVPPELRPLELMRLVGITIETSRPQRKPAPPESRFDE